MYFSIIQEKHAIGGYYQTLQIEFFLNKLDYKEVRIDKSIQNCLGLLKMSLPSTLPNFESSGFHYDSTDFAMPSTPSHIVRPCEIMTYEWEDDGDNERDNEKSSTTNES